MPLNIGNDDYKAWADENAQEFNGYSTLSENFAAGVGLMVDEESSISSFYHSVNLSQRDDDIRKLIKSGDIPPDIAESFTRGNPGRSKVVDYNGIAEYVNDLNLFPDMIDTDKVLTDQRNEELAVRRRYRDKVSGTALFGGDIANFGGIMAGSMLDPVNAATAFLAVPVAGARATSKALYAMTIAGKSAGLNMAVSASLEPIVHSWKEEIGATYTIEESIANIAASGLLGGLVGGISAALAKNLPGREYSGYTEKQKSEIIDDLDEKIKNNAFDESSPDINFADEEKLADIAEIFTSDEKGLRKAHFADVEQLVKSLDKDGINAISVKNLSEFGDTLKDKGIYESEYLGIRDLARTLRANDVKVIKVADISKYLDDIADKRAINSNGRLKYIEGELNALDMHEDEVGDIMRFLEEAEAAPPNMKSKDFVEAAEARQEKMEGGYQKKDIPPTADVNNPASVDPRLTEKLTDEAEGADPIEEFMLTLEDGTQVSSKDVDRELDAEVDYLNQKVECLNA